MESAGIAGQRVTLAPKRIASVWKHGWMLKSTSPLMLELAARREAAAALAVAKPHEIGGPS